MQRRMERDAGLDAARALATCAMVIGHTLDGTLAPAVRELPALQVYWSFRGLTAPLFMLVSGWAVATVIGLSSKRGLELVRGRLPRVALLLALGYLLRLPLWGMHRLRAGDEAVWRHFLAFDALHLIGTSLLIGTLVAAVLPASGARALAYGALTALMAVLGAVVPGALIDAPLWIAQSVGGGKAQFPLVPWSGYFFAGALLGTLSPRLGTALRRSALVATTGLALLGASVWAGMSASAPEPTVLFAWRLGQILLMAAALGLLPGRWTRPLAPIGRASLGVYVLHLPVVYGWGYWAGIDKRIGKTLSLPQGLLLGVALLSACLAITLGYQRLKAMWRQRAATREIEPSVAVVPEGGA